MAPYSHLKTSYSHRGAGARTHNPINRFARLTAERLEDRTLLSTNLGNVPTWVPQGPGPITNGQSQEGTAPNNNRVVGGIEAIAINPNDINEAYVGAINGGIWHTENVNAATPTWTIVNDQLPSLAIGAIAFSPLDATGRTVFAGTGRFSSFAAQGGPTVGLLRTTDAGAHWSLLGQTVFGNFNVASVIPTTLTGATGGQVILVATSGGVFRSDNGGDTFNSIPVLTGNISEMVAGPNSDSVFYAGVITQGVFRSNDGGQTWNPVNTGITGIPNTVRILVSAAGNSVYASLYAAVTPNMEQLTGVFKTTNQGANWRAIQNQQQPNPGGQGNIHASILADPSDPTVFYIGGDRQAAAPFVGNLFRVVTDDANPASDGWQSIVLAGTAANTAPHADSRAMVFIGANILQADDGGVYRLLNPGNAATRDWVSANGNIQPTEFHSVAYDSLNDVVFGGTQDVGSSGQITAGGSTWTTPDRALLGDGNTQAVDNTGPNTLRYQMANDFNRFYRLPFNNANTLVGCAPIANCQVRLAAPATPAVNFSGLNAADQVFGFRIHPYVLNSVIPQRIMLGGNNLYEDDQTGPAHTTGNIITNVTPAGQTDTSAIAYGGRLAGAPNPDVAYVGFCNLNIGTNICTNPTLFLRTNAGGPFNQLTGYIGNTPRDIVMDPDNWRTVFVTDGTNVFRGTNVGQPGEAWATITSNLTGIPNGVTSNLQTLELVKTGTTSVLLVGGFGGVFRAVLAATATQLWTEIGQALPNVLAKDLRYNATDDVLLAGTFGRGAWTIPNAGAAITAPVPPGVLNIFGDTDFIGQNDDIVLIRDATQPAYLNVFINNTTNIPDFQYQLAAIKQITVFGLAGNDTLRVDNDNGLISVPSGIRYLAGTGFNALVADADSPNQFVAHYLGRATDSGVVRVFQNAISMLDIYYENTQVVTPQVFSSANLLEMGPDFYEPNETFATAAHVGSGSTVHIEHAAIFPDPFEFPQVPQDQDYYRIIAQDTGTLDFKVDFDLYSTALLPAGGALNIRVFDANGFQILGFQQVTPTGDARARIPVVAGKTYYLHVFSTDPNAVNGYDVTILNVKPPVPYDVELSRTTPNGDLPPNAPEDDTGRSETDNITFKTTPTIFVRLADNVFLLDPGQTPGPIPIPFSTTGATAGYRLAIFDGDAPNTPVGFAIQEPTPGFPGLYRFTFSVPLNNGIHHFIARVQMVDPTLPLHNTGFGDASVISLDIVVDTVPPIVAFGNPPTTDQGLDPKSDTGVVGIPSTFTDRITSDTTPAFFGLAEADAIVRAYVDMNGNGIVEKNIDLFIGETVAIPIDGEFPYTGQWNLQSIVDLNNPAYFPLENGRPADGTRSILVTAEDVAGNVSPQADQLNIFLDTQGPQINMVAITSQPIFNLFALKPLNAPAGPTPLVHSLTISFTDYPDRDNVNFPNHLALSAVANAPGHYLLKGDNAGIIAIQQIIVTNNPPQNGQAATAAIELRFFDSLPDDRFTLTISDTLNDFAGNKLDGESNATAPLNIPSFPSGDLQPGGTFSARFTVNSRPEIGTYCCGTQYIDINGNGVFDPVNKDGDQVNRDIVFNFGLTTDVIFAGNFVHTGGQANGFDKFGAYGRTNQVFRWLLDFDSDSIPDWNVVSGLQIDGRPVAYKFNPALSGDQIALFNGFGKWYIDFNGTNNIGPASLVINNGLTGFPIAGDFDGNGQFDLATYRPDLKTFYFDLNPLGGPHTSPTIAFGFAGTQVRPVAADMDKDGTTDVGLFVVGKQGQSGDVPEWYFLVSGGASTVAGSVNTLNHPFEPTPFGNDLFYKFGNNQAIPLVGLFDPPGSNDGPTPPPHFTFHSLDTVITGSAPGQAPIVRGFDGKTGQVRFSFFAYNQNFTGGVRVAAGDLNGDGVPDIVTAPQGGGAPHVRIFSGAGGNIIGDFYAYNSSLIVGVTLAIGDVNGDGFADLVTGTASGNPHIRVFNGKHIADGIFNPNGGSRLAEWFAYGLNFNVGAYVATGDINGDGYADVVTGASLGNPHVKVFNGKAIAIGGNPASNILAQFFPYALQFNVGATVSIGDINHDGFADIVTGATIGNPHVRVYNGKDIVIGKFNPTGSSQLAQWFAYGLNFNVGANVAIGDMNGDGFGDVITGASSGNPHVKVYSGNLLALGNVNASLLAQFFASTPGGVTVGAAGFGD